MNIYKELKQIAETNALRKKLAKEFLQKVDVDGLYMEEAELIQGCSVVDGHLVDSKGSRLDNCGLVDNNYYCDQRIGYCEDDYYGKLYFATEEQGTYVAIPFSV